MDHINPSRTTRVPANLAAETLKVQRVIAGSLIRRLVASTVVYELETHSLLQGDARGGNMGPNAYDGWYAVTRRSARKLSEDTEARR